MSEGRTQVREVHGADSNEELLGRYAEWAATYEADMIQGLGYTMPWDAARILSRYVPRSAPVLDAGAGTGLVGQALAALGYRDITAIDMSAEMLKEAQEKGVYSQYHQMVLGEPLGFAANTFAATISIGTFTVGHAPASAMDELVRVTRPGGCIVFSLPDHLSQQGPFKEKFSALLGRWTLEECSEPFIGLPGGDRTLLYQYWVYRVV